MNRNARRSPALSLAIAAALSASAFGQQQTQQQQQAASAAQQRAAMDAQVQRQMQETQARVARERAEADRVAAERQRQQAEQQAKSEAQRRQFEADAAARRAAATAATPASPAASVSSASAGPTNGIYPDRHRPVDSAIPQAVRTPVPGMPQAPTGDVPDARTSKRLPPEPIAGRAGHWELIGESTDTQTVELHDHYGRPYTSSKLVDVFTWRWVSDGVAGGGPAGAGAGTGGASGPPWGFGNNPATETIGGSGPGGTNVQTDPNGVPPQPSPAVYTPDGAPPPRQLSPEQRADADLFAGLAASSSSRGGEGADGVSGEKGASVRADKVPWDFGASGTGQGDKDIYNAYVGGRIVQVSGRDPNVVGFDGQGRPVGADGLVVEYADLAARDYSINVVAKEVAAYRAEQDHELREMLPELFMSPAEIEAKRAAEAQQRASDQKWLDEVRARGGPQTATERWRAQQIAPQKLSWDDEMKLNLDALGEQAAGVRAKASADQQRMEKEAAELGRAIRESVATQPAGK